MGDTQKYDLCFIGGIIMDMTSYMDNFPKPGETKVGSRFVTGFGGKAANQAAMAAKLGAKVAMVGRVGNDPNGRAYVEHFRSLDIDVTNMKISEDGQTGAATIWVNDAGQNCICVILGANLDMTDKDIYEAEEAIAASSVVVVGLEVSLDVARTALKVAEKHGVQTIWNAAPMPVDMPADMFALPHVFNVNETEASIATGIDVVDVESAKTAARALVEQKHCKTVVMTLGDKGSVFGPSGNGEMVHVSTTGVKAVDSTGAGDAFLGALGFFWAKYPQLPVDLIVRKSCEVATLSVLKPGTQTSFPSLNELPEGFMPE